MIAIIGNAEQASRALGEPLAGREGGARAGQRDAAGGKAQAVAGGKQCGGAGGPMARPAARQGWRHDSAGSAPRGQAL